MIMDSKSTHKLGLDIETILLFMSSVAIFGLLFLRDAMGYSVNKWIFLIILAPLLLFLSERNMMTLWCFVMPLYVGLPGNYLTLIMLARFGLKYILNGFKAKDPVLFITVFLAAIYILAQNLFFGITTIFRNMFVIELFIAYFVFCEEEKNNFGRMFTSYAVGVATVGIIMLVYTLRLYGLDELFTASTRLGSTARPDEMTIIIDSNYYGLYVIAVLSIGWLMLRKRQLSRKQMVLVSLSMFAAIFVACVGLSRAFILGMALWVMMVILVEKNIGMKVFFTLFVAIIACIIYWAIPGAVEALLERFEGDDMATGNGRITFIIDYGRQWLETPWTIMFGVGFAGCRVHCMHAQYIFGLGIIGAGFYAAMGSCYWIRARQQGRKYRAFEYAIPAISAQIIAATIPIAQAFTFLMPIFMTVLAYKEINK